MLQHLLVFVFGFTCGGIVLVLCILFLLYRFLTHMEEKSTELNSRKELAVVKLRNSEVLSPSKGLQCHIKLQTEHSNEPYRQTPWTFAVLKANCIFVFSDNTKSNLLHIINLDYCNITITNKNWAATSNALDISHPENELLDNSKQIFIYFAVGRELEEWYWGVKIASKLSIGAEGIVEEEKRIENHFEELLKKLRPAEGDCVASTAWVNAVLPRLWWNLFDNKSFKRFIAKRLGKRIAKITDFPKFIESMVLHSIELGPTLPFISNVSLHNLSSEGGVEVDLDLEYEGGLSIKILIKTSMSLPGTSLELPATAVITVNKLVGKLRLRVSPPPCERFWIGFHKLPDTEIQADTQIGLMDTQATRNIPRIANNIIKKLKGDLTKVIVNKLKADIVGEKMVLPNMDDFPIPYFTHQDGEEDENYMSQVILTRDTPDVGVEKRPSVHYEEVEKKPSTVTILKKQVGVDQIIPMIKSHAKKDGLKKLKSSHLRPLHSLTHKDFLLVHPKRHKKPFFPNSSCAQVEEHSFMRRKRTPIPHRPRRASVM